MDNNNNIWCLITLAVVVMMMTLKLIGHWFEFVNTVCK